MNGNNNRSVGGERVGGKEGRGGAGGGRGGESTEEARLQCDLGKV